MNGEEWLRLEKQRLQALEVDTTATDLPESYVVVAGFPKPKYYIVETPDEYLVYAEENHGEFT